MAATKKKDLFDENNPSAGDGYSAKDIEVLEGLEPVRLRPGMYIGGTDDRALHHLFAEVIDNSMDEAVAGHATRIEVELEADGFLTVTDNGRGIPVDPHPKYPKKSALGLSSPSYILAANFQTKPMRHLVVYTESEFPLSTLYQICWKLKLRKTNSFTG